VLFRAAIQRCSQCKTPGEIRISSSSEGMRIGPNQNLTMDWGESHSTEMTHNSNGWMSWQPVLGEQTSRQTKICPGENGRSEQREVLFLGKSMQKKLFTYQMCCKCDLDRSDPRIQKAHNPWWGPEYSCCLYSKHLNRQLTPLIIYQQHQIKSNDCC